MAHLERIVDRHSPSGLCVCRTVRCVRHTDSLVRNRHFRLSMKQKSSNLTARLGSQLRRLHQGIRYKPEGWSVRDASGLVGTGSSAARTQVVWVSIVSHKTVLCCMSRKSHLLANKECATSSTEACKQENHQLLERYDSAAIAAIERLLIRLR